MKSFWAMVVLFCATPIFIPAAFTAEYSRVTTENAKVYSSPDLSSDILMEIKKGSLVQSSSATSFDARKNSWYKIRLDNGGIGYIQADDLETKTAASDLRSAGIVGRHGAGISQQTTPWSYVVRAMGFAGAFTTRPTRIAYGGEMEVSACLLWNSHGYAHRQYGFGVAYSRLGSHVSNFNVVSASFIYRIFTYVRSEPEVRIRLGRDFSSAQTVVGLNLGMRYPFSLTEKAHLAAYLEGGGSVVTGSPSLTAFIGSAGLGYHF